MMKYSLGKFGVFVILIFFSVELVYSASKPPAAAIATAHPLATKAGMDILAQGGNAFDAAVAVSAALAVVEPYGSGLGGGGFWLLHRASDGFETMIDGRETAPAKAHRNMYLDEDGQVLKKLSIDGPLSAGIPGAPAALSHISKSYGNLDLADTLAPAIRLAREGFNVDERYLRLAGFRKNALKESAEATKIFLHRGDVPSVGHRIKQPDLAWVLESIAKQGRNGFYTGAVAQKLVSGVKNAGGLWQLSDLKNYRVKERKPLVGHYKGIKVTTVPPPSSGGVAILSMLNILSGYDLEKLDPITQKHLMVEAMRRAYRDRAAYLGDSDFVKVPIKRLTNPYYADGLRASIRADRATASTSLPGVAFTVEGPHTTHFSILDQEGNRVAATLSINYPFGSAFVPEGTGVLLNDEMDDFSAKPGEPNAYGLVGNEANAIAPGKRPLSSMSPTFLDDGDRVGILGTPGGSRIISMVLLGILDYARGNKPESWVRVGRFHHQYLPDTVEYEPDGLDTRTLQGLARLGHKTKKTQFRYGNMQAILWQREEDRVTAASDQRGMGRAIVH